MEIKLLIIIVTYNSATDIRRCIEGCHLIENEKSIVISDNCSADDTAKIARELGCEVILNENNLGYSKAINKAVEVFGANDYSHLLILNPDAFIVDPIKANFSEKNYDFIWPNRKSKKNYNLAFNQMMISLKKIVNFAKKKKVNIAIETEGSYRKKNFLLLNLILSKKSDLNSFL